MNAMTTNRPAPAALLLLLASMIPAAGTEYHVATTGDDANPGTAAAPFRTIQRAADLALPGDVITVHAGIYRERVNPRRGGDSPERPIVYRAAPGEHVEIRGSEVVRGWTPLSNGVWRIVLPNTFFGPFNPFADPIRGDWFYPLKRPHHTGAVYLDGEELVEAASLEELERPPATPPAPGWWFATVDTSNTTILARFGVADPNVRLVEVNARRTVFYPDRPGRDFITVRGFVLRHAATPWAPPTAEQVGLIGTHWSRGWVIEQNVISHSRCVGVTLGKYGDQFDNTSEDTATGYVATIHRALQHGWHRDRIGHHLVRDNVISHCEQAGLVGSLGAIFSVISNNVIHTIHTRRRFGGAEQAGIKIHAAIDARIEHNLIVNAYRGIWLDWMAQGTRVTRNVCISNSSDDVFVEVNHGPFVLDHNWLCSPVSLRDWSQGGAFVHNFFGGKIISRPELARETPYHRAHSTELAGMSAIQGGDHRFFANIFAPPAPAKEHGYGLHAYATSALPVSARGNIYANGAQPLPDEPDAVRLGAPIQWSLEIGPGGHWQLRWSGPCPPSALAAPIRSTQFGLARIPNLPFVNPDDSPMVFDVDFAGHPRSASSTAGPLQTWPADGAITLWPSTPERGDLRR
ncbi:MAG: DUF1565 domain-containing protein [Kiritimatiellae bacterium]|nr:DUF1565 domain-containing protein [Kiritimatiellia bacterium]